MQSSSHCLSKIQPEEFDESVSESNEDRLIKLQSHDRVDAWSSDGCIQHAGDQFVSLSFICSKHKTRVVARFDCAFVAFLGSREVALVDAGDVQGKWRVWLCEKTRFSYEYRAQR